MLSESINDECEDDESEEYQVEFLDPREPLQSTKQALGHVAPVVNLAVVLPRVEPRPQQRHNWLVLPTPMSVAESRSLGTHGP